MSNVTVMALVNVSTGHLRVFFAANGYVGENVPNRTLTVDLNGALRRFGGGGRGGGSGDINSDKGDTGAEEGDDDPLLIAPKSAQLWRIDEAHCNPKQLWQSWGSPSYLKPAQVAALKKAAELPPPEHVTIVPAGEGGMIEIDLPAFGVAVLDVILVPK